MGVVRIIRFNTSDVDRSFTAHDASDSTRSYSSKPAWVIPIYNLKYARQSCVGMSAFSSVYKGFWLDTPVVVKFMGYEADDDPNNESKLKLFRHELRVWFLLKHPHAINLFGACDIGKRFFVCEYAANGTLREHIHKLPLENEKWTKFYEISLSLQCIHGLKCYNFLVGADGKAKITYFDLSCIQNRAGAKHWKSPEYLRGERLTLASGIYSFGMCILEAMMMTGGPLWGALSEPAVGYQVVRMKRLPQRPPMLSDSQWTLVEMMCAYEPSHRVSIAFVVDRLYELSQQEFAALPL